VVKKSIICIIKGRVKSIIYKFNPINTRLNSDLINTMFFSILCKRLKNRWKIEKKLKKHINTGLKEIYIDYREKNEPTMSR